MISLTSSLPHQRCVHYVSASLPRLHSFNHFSCPVLDSLQCIMSLTPQTLNWTQCSRFRPTSSQTSQSLTHRVPFQMKDFAFILAQLLEVPEEPVDPLNAHLQLFWLSLHQDPCISGNTSPAYDSRQNQSSDGRGKNQRHSVFSWRLKSIKPSAPSERLNTLSLITSK